jgi:modification methylase
MSQTASSTAVKKKATARVKNEQNNELKKKKTTSKLENKVLTPDDFRNKLICGDALAEMRKMPDACLDLVVTSPPYNLKNSTGNGMKDGRGGKWANASLLNGYSHHDDSMPHDEYAKWQRDCLTEMLRLIKDDGAIFYNHKWRVQGGLIQDRQDIVAGFPIRQIIIWRRKGGINFNKGYFLPTYEVIYLICKKKFVLAKGASSHGDVWEIGQEMKNSHPAPFPVALIERIIGSTNAQLILDPFMGSGTTAIAAKRLGRDYVGIEISPEYIDIAEQRIANDGNLPIINDNKTLRLAGI